MVEEVVQVGGEVGVVVVLAVEVDALCRMAWRLRQAHKGIHPQQVDASQRGEEDEARFGVALQEAPFQQVGGEPYLVGGLFVPPVVVADTPVGGGQGIAVAAEEGAKAHQA